MVLYSGQWIYTRRFQADSSGMFIFQLVGQFRYFINVSGKVQRFGTDSVNIGILSWRIG